MAFGVGGTARRGITLGLAALAFAAATFIPAPTASAFPTMLGLIRSADQPNLCIVGWGNEDKLQLRLAECSTATPWYHVSWGAYPNAGRFQTWGYLECMGVRDSSRNNGARVQQNDCNGNTSQLWVVDHVQREIRNVNSGKCVSAPSLAVGVGLIQYDCGVYPSDWLYPSL